MFKLQFFLQIVGLVQTAMSLKLQFLNFLTFSPAASNRIRTLDLDISVECATTVQPGKTKIPYFVLDRWSDDLKILKLKMIFEAVFLVVCDTSMNEL